MTIRRRHALAALPALALLSRRAAAQAYPSRPVTIVAPFAAGGSTDFVARLLAQELAARLGGQFVVDNRAGASGTVGAGSVARARPDGTTLLMAPNSTYAMAPFLYDNLTYDPALSFTPISLLATNAMFLCVRGQDAVRDIAGLVAAAKAAPGQVSYGSAGIGVSNHLAAEIFVDAMKIDLLHVPYRGGAPAMQALLAGEIRASFVDTVTALPYLKSGELRALAVTGASRDAQAPDVPTMAESGIPGYRASTDFALFAPAGTPEEILATLSRAAIAAMRSAEVQQRLAPLAIEPVGGTRAEFAAYFAAETAKWGNIIRARNIRAS